jgi:hypothetical protein
MEYVRDNIQALYDFAFRTINDVVSSASPAGQKQASLFSQTQTSDASYTAAGRRAVGLAGDALNTYGAGLLATGAGYFGAAGSPTPQDPKRSAPASPSVHESSGTPPGAHSEGYSLNGDL